MSAMRETLGQAQRQREEYLCPSGIWPPGVLAGDRPSPPRARGLDWVAPPAWQFSLSGARRSHSPHLGNTRQLGTVYPAPNPHPPLGNKTRNAPLQGRRRAEGDPLNSPGGGPLHLGLTRRQTAGEPIPRSPPHSDLELLRPQPQGHQQEDHLPCLVTAVSPRPWAPGSHPRVKLRVPPSGSGSQHPSVPRPLVKGPPRPLPSCPPPDRPPQEEASLVPQAEVPRQNQ